MNRRLFATAPVALGCSRGVHAWVWSSRTARGVARLSAQHEPQAGIVRRCLWGVGVDLLGPARRALPLQCLISYIGVWRLVVQGSYKITFWGEDQNH